jgi:D-3-phosphoglycerate dehydrogenase
LEADHTVRYVDVPARPEWVPSDPSELGLREYLGSPADVIAALEGDDVLVVQGAPVTDRVIASCPSLRLVCCARGGPVNIDVAAATARGIPVVSTPGKNADAVAELTMAFMVMIARRLPEAVRYVEAGGEAFRDNYEGKLWFGHDLAGHDLGLVGFGAIGQRVARRAQAFGMRVTAHDPFVHQAVAAANGVELCDLPTLIESSDFVSVHARLTADNHGLFGEAEFGAMPQGAYFINTARHELIDEVALIAALRSGHLGGAALDIATPSPAVGRHPLLEIPNVVLAPHIGGATSETLRHGGEMAVAEIERFADGRDLINRTNGAELDRAMLAAHPAL